jgi:nitroreductase
VPDAHRPPVEQEKIDKIIECANYAPTGVNKQPFRLWLMQSDEAVENIKKVTTYTFGAGLFLVVGGNPAEAWVRSFDNWNISEVDDPEMADYDLVAIFPIGYPADNAPPVTNTRRSVANSTSTTPPTRRMSRWWYGFTAAVSKAAANTSTPNY